MGAHRREDGTGVIGTVLGAGAFLVLVMFAAQVLLGLYTRSVIAAATYDAAVAVAGADLAASPSALADAEANAQAQLGAYGRRVRFDWHDADPRLDTVVRLTARGPRPALLPASLAGAVGLGDIVRTVTVRREAPR